MKEDKTTPLREWMIEDMRIRGLGANTQQAHIRVVLSRLRSGLSTHLCGLSFECQGAFATQR
jgi:hypothetical protein